MAMDTYRATRANGRSQDSVTRALKRFVRKTAPTRAQREAAMARAATVVLEEKRP